MTLCAEHEVVVEVPHQVAGTSSILDDVPNTRRRANQLKLRLIVSSQTRWNRNHPSPPGIPLPPGRSMSPHAK